MSDHQYTTGEAVASLVALGSLIYLAQTDPKLRLLLRLAAEHGSAAQKAYKGNHDLLCGVNVAPADRQSGKYRHGQDDEREQRSGQYAGVVRCAFKRCEDALNELRHGRRNGGDELIGGGAADSRWSRLFRRGSVIGFAHGRLSEYRKFWKADDTKWATMGTRDLIVAHVIDVTREAA